MKIRYFTKRDEVWLDFRDPRDGSRRRIPSGCKTNAQAQAQALAVITRWLKGQEAVAGATSASPDHPTFGVVADVGSHRKGTGMTFKEAFSRGMKERKKWLESKDKASILTSYEQVAAAWGGDGALLSTVTKQAVLNWRSDLMAAPGKRKGSTMTASTINHRLSMLTCLLELADLPGHGVKHLSTRGNERERRITDKEIEDMRQWLLARPERPGTVAMAALILAGLETAARQSDLLELDWVDVAVETVSFRDTKNKSSRTIPASPTLRALLEARRYVAGGPFRDINQDRATALWDAARSGIGLAHDTQFVFHGLRHEKLSRLGDSGASSLMLKAFAGHDSVSTTERYVHSSVGAMREMLAVEGKWES